MPLVVKVILDHLGHATLDMAAGPGGMLTPHRRVCAPTTADVTRHLLKEETGALEIIWR